MTIEHIPAGEFKTHCLKLLDEVGCGNRTLIVTKHGKPVAKVVPVTRTKKPNGIKAGFMKGTILYQGDIVSPSPELWNLPE
jgi:prevent-host-death family protein